MTDQIAFTVNCLLTIYLSFYEYVANALQVPCSVQREVSLPVSELLLNPSLDF